MVVAAMLAMMLVAASPAFAQDVNTAGDVSGTAVGGNLSVVYVDASQFQFAAVGQAQFGDATSVAGDLGSSASSEISQEVGISQWQWNGGF